MTDGQGDKRAAVNIRQKMEVKMYKKVLVSLDGSELAECALNHVKNILQNNPSGEVVLLNVVVVDIPWRTLNVGEEGHSITFDINTIVKSFMDKSRRYLAKVKYRFSSELSDGVKITTEAIESDRPSQTITDYAQKNGVDLIVLATHGYTGMKKMLLGGTALKVLHEAHVPVLLIRPEACCG
jgi:nucleotide-binding universal stress UspA family protein